MGRRAAEWLHSLRDPSSIHLQVLVAGMRCESPWRPRTSWEVKQERAVLTAHVLREDRQ